MSKPLTASAVESTVGVNDVSGFNALADSECRKRLTTCLNVPLKPQG